jgi:4'-phosphopantetheinyl transferase
MSSIQHLWQTPPADLILEKDMVHVWRASLRVRVPAIDLHQLQATLTADEIHRAARFYFQKDRDHYIAGRGLVRAILGRYLDIAPGEIRFRYGLHGKPELDSSIDRRDISFNVSHSHDLALIAVATARKERVGRSVAENGRQRGKKVRKSK